MSNQLLSSLHLNTETGFRGGENQILLLLRHLTVWGQEPVLACLPGQPLWERARAAGIEVWPFPYPGEFSPGGLTTLLQYLRSRPFRIVHAHTSRTATLAGVAARLTPGVKGVVARRVDFSTKGNFLRGWKYSRLPAAVIAISQGIREVLVADGIEPARIRVIPSGIDPTRFDGIHPALRAELGVGPETPILLTVAHLTEHKGLRFLLDAMPQLLGGFPSLQCVLVGNGELREDLEAQAKALTISQHVRFLGFRADVAPLLSDADVFVLPSIEEGLGTSILDAMVCRKPVVASRVGGIPEAVSHEETGLLVPPGNPSALVVALAALLRNQALRQRYGEAGRARVLALFTAERMARETLNVYDELVEEAPSLT